jgi:hypothetical protein
MDPDPSAAPITITRPPRLLDEDDRAWLDAHAAKVGGLHAAFVYLVRLAILLEAIDSVGHRMYKHRARLRKRHGRRAATAFAVRHIVATSTVSRLVQRVTHASLWTRPQPGEPHAPFDDPHQPLPESVTLRLIAEGRPAFTVLNRHARARLQCR